MYSKEAIRSMVEKEENLKKVIDQKDETIKFIRGEMMIAKENAQLLFEENQLLKEKLSILINHCNT